MSAADRVAKAQAEAQSTSPDPTAEAPPAGSSVSDRAVQKSRFQKMREHFAAQRKVPVRLQEDTFVQVNGYTFQIKGKERVMVPEQIGDLLIESGLV